MELTTFKLPANEISLLRDLFVEHDSRWYMSDCLVCLPPFQSRIPVSYI
jgi:hypothetical protein